MGKKTSAAPAMPDGDGFDALIGGEAKVVEKTTGGKKSADPAIDLPKGELNGHLLTFISKKAEMKNAESEMRSHEAEILGHVLPIVDDLNFNKDIPATTLLINGKMADGKAVSVKLVMSDRFSLSNDSAVIGALKTELGEDFGKAVIEDTIVSIKPEVFENPDLKAEFMALLGEKAGETFRKFFVAEKKFVAKKGLLDNLWKLAKTKTRLASIKSFLVLAKPALK